MNANPEGLKSNIFSIKIIHLSVKEHSGHSDVNSMFGAFLFDVPFLYFSLD